MTRPPLPASHVGLTPAEAASRLARLGPNLLPGSTPKSLGSIVVGVLVEVPVMLSVVKIVKATKPWYEGRTHA